MLCLSGLINKNNSRQYVLCGSAARNLIAMHYRRHRVVWPALISSIIISLIRCTPTLVYRVLLKITFKIINDKVLAIFYTSTHTYFFLQTLSLRCIAAMLVHFYTPTGVLLPPGRRTFICTPCCQQFWLTRVTYYEYYVLLHKNTEIFVMHVLWNYSFDYLNFFLTKACIADRGFWV